jgi:hypothetical protein
MNYIHSWVLFETNQSLNIIDKKLKAQAKNKLKKILFF